MWWYKKSKAHVLLIEVENGVAPTEKHGKYSKGQGQFESIQLKQ